MTGRHILVIRLSALGDVAMLYPVIYNVLEENSDVQITLLTRTPMAQIFSHLSRVKVVCVETQSKHKGLWGLFRLYWSLRAVGITSVVDTHNVLRSRVLGHFFRLQGVAVHRLDKQREARKKLLRKEHKQRTALVPVVEKYRQTFIEAGIRVRGESAPPIFSRSKNPTGVGFAPFAGFTQKELPWETVVSLVKRLSDDGVAVHLFSAPGKQRAKLQSLSHLPHVSVVSFSGGLREELAFMATLSVMLSMDSANGHLAALVGCPVITIWGATHRDAGFVAHTAVNHVEISTDELSCRPCSAFGNVPCHRGDLACLNRLEVDNIMEALTSVLK